MTNSPELEKLIVKRDALRARLDSIKADYKSGLSSDLSEQAIELENREVLDEIARTTQEDLDRIERSIAKLKTTA